MKKHLFILAWPLLALGCGNTVIDEASGPRNDGAPPGDSLRDPAPGVVVTTPLDGATGSPTNGNASITFDGFMDCASLTPSSFTLTSDTNIPVAGSVICSGARAVFWPDTQLDEHRTWTARVTTTAKSSDGVGLPQEYRWRFTTGIRFAAGIGVELGSAADFTVLGQTGIRTTPGSSIRGNVGISPFTSKSIDGFGLSADPSGDYFLSAAVVGRVYAPDLDDSSIGLSEATHDMRIAFADAAARAPDFSNWAMGTGDHLALAPGVYRWDADLRVSGDVALVGDQNDVWIFQVAGDFSADDNTHVALSGGALAKNVYWQVSGAAHVGIGSELEGIVLAKRDITLAETASVDGKLMSQSSISLDDDRVSEAHQDGYRFSQ